MTNVDTNRYELVGNLYVLPTPAGAYHAVSTAEDNRIRRLLTALLRQPSSTRIDVETLCSWTGENDAQAALEVLHRAQTLAWVEGFPERRDLPDVGVGQELRQLLPGLSAIEQGIIVDWNGLAIASCGIDDETADTLAALAADLIGVQERHAERMGQHLGRASHGWAAVDAYGSSRIGAWPLYIGDKRLLLVLLGEPRLNEWSFVAIVWLLMRNYG
jgi:hypothetical protein